MWSLSRAPSSLCRRPRREQPLGLSSVAAVAATTGAVAAQPQSSGTTELISVKADGTIPQHRDSYWGDVSSNGRYVVFESYARLVDGVGRTHGAIHVYVRDRELGITTAVDLRTSGKLAHQFGMNPTISADGRYVAFQSSDNYLTSQPLITKFDQILVRDTVTGTTVLATTAVDGGPADSLSEFADISADGSVVVFDSLAGNLIEGETGGHEHVYRRDLATATTSLVSRTATGEFPNGGSYHPSTSADGNVIAFATAATDIVEQTQPSMYVVSYDVARDSSTAIATAWNGGPADDASQYAAVGDDGTTIAYESAATDVVPDDTNESTDVFVYDVATRATTLASISFTGGPSDNSSFFPALDAGGGLVAFESWADNLVPDDENGASNDVFVRDRATGVTTMIIRTPDGEPTEVGGYFASIAGNGSVVSYESYSDELVPGTRGWIGRVCTHTASADPRCRRW